MNRPRKLLSTRENAGYHNYQWNKTKQKSMSEYEIQGKRGEVVSFKEVQDILYLAERFISPPTRAPHSQPKLCQKALAPPPTCIVLMLQLASLQLSSPLGIFEAFRWNVIHLAIVDTNFLSHRPEILTVPYDPKIKWVHRTCTRRRERQPVRSLSPGKPVESKEVEKESATRPRRGRHGEYAAMSVITLVHPGFCFAVLVAPLGTRCVLVLVLVLVAMAHLNPRAAAACGEAPATAHEAVSSEVGDFERGKLTGDLPKLCHEEYGRPSELESGP